MKAALNVVPPVLLHCPMMSEVNVGAMAVGQGCKWRVLFSRCAGIISASFVTL